MTMALPLNMLNFKISSNFQRSPKFCTCSTYFFDRIWRFSSSQSLREILYVTHYTWPFQRWAMSTSGTIGDRSDTPIAIHHNRSPHRHKPESRIMKSRVGRAVRRRAPTRHTSRPSDSDTTSPLRSATYTMTWPVDSITQYRDNITRGEKVHRSERLTIREVA